MDRLELELQWRIKRSHRCQRARIGRRIQENVVTRVDQHLKHLRGGQKQRNWRTGKRLVPPGLSQIPYRAPPGFLWSHRCPSVHSQGCGWPWPGCEGSSAGSSSMLAAQVFYITADILPFHYYYYQILICFESYHCPKFNHLRLVSGLSPIRSRVLQGPLHGHLIESNIASILQLNGGWLEGERVGVGGSSCQRDEGWRRALLQLGFVQVGCETQERQHKQRWKSPCRNQVLKHKNKVDLKGTTNYT